MSEQTVSVPASTRFAAAGVARAAGAAGEYESGGRCEREPGEDGATLHDSS
jgi:hypothetical protein